MESVVPARAPTTTAISGGVRHATNKTNPISAMAKSAEVLTELVHKGL